MNLTRKPAMRDGPCDRWFEGVIIGFDAHRGTILLNPQAVPSIQIALESFMEGERSYVAPFTWNCLRERDRNTIINSRSSVRIVSAASGSRRNGKSPDRKQPMSRRETIGERLIGHVVHCRIAKNPKAKIVEVLIQFGKGRLQLPFGCLWRPTPGNASCPPKFPPTCIRGRLNRVAPRNNARRPWPGMTQ